MITYLKAGWYAPRGKHRMRNEVVDGAIDAAGMLFRAGVPPQVISSVAFKLRTLVSVVDPFMQVGSQAIGRDVVFGDRQRTMISQRIEPLTQDTPVLHAFITDCLDHITNAADLRAFYLHLFHITQMVQLLSAAMGPLGGLIASNMLDTTSPSEPWSLPPPLPPTLPATKKAKATKKAPQTRKAKSTSRTTTKQAIAKKTKTRPAKAKTKPR